jgi:hypothetical protein
MRSGMSPYVGYGQFAPVSGLTIVALNFHQQRVQYNFYYGGGNVVMA